jgi:hypothetical protein
MSAPTIANIFKVAVDGQYCLLFDGKITITVPDAMNLAAWIAALTESEEVYDIAKGIEGQQDDLPF